MGNSRSSILSSRRHTSVMWRRGDVLHGQQPVLHIIIAQAYISDVERGGHVLHGQKPLLHIIIAQAYISDVEKGGRATWAKAAPPYYHRASIHQ